MSSLIRIAAMLAVSLTTHAALVGRAPLTPGGTDYQAYYDDVQNITWLRDANLARSNSFGVDGICAGPGEFGSGCPDVPGAMDWFTANNWITAMNAASYLGMSNWRMPRTVQPDVGCSGRTNPTPAPRQYYGRDCTLSEMPRLFSTGITWYAPGVFLNMPAPESMWSSTPYALDAGQAWAFNFYYVGGWQEATLKTNKGFVMPVLDGDAFAVVPVASAAWLFGSALGVVGWLRRRGSAPG